MIPVYSTTVLYYMIKHTLYNVCFIEQFEHSLVDKALLAWKVCFMAFKATHCAAWESLVDFSNDRGLLVIKQSMKRDSRVRDSMHVYLWLWVEYMWLTERKPTIFAKKKFPIKMHWNVMVNYAHTSKNEVFYRDFVLKQTLFLVMLMDIETKLYFDQSGRQWWMQ